MGEGRKRDLIEERFLVLDDRDEHKTDSAIAENLGVERSWVTKVRQDLTSKNVLTNNFRDNESKRDDVRQAIENDPDASNVAIAEETGVSDPTVGKVRNEMESESTDGSDDSATDSERSDGHTSPSDDGRGIDDDTPSSDGATPIDVSQDSQTDTDTDDSDN